MNFNVIKTADTANGYGIAMIEELNYRTGDRVYFSVARYNADNKFIVLSRHATFAKASSAALREWCADRSAAGLGI